MKKILLIGATSLGLALGALAGSPAFKSFSGAGNAATPTTVIIPADPNLQFRLLSLNYSSDTNNGGFAFSKGGTAFYSLGTNNITGGTGATAVTNTINTTNGLIPSSVIVLQKASGACYQNTLASWGGTAGAYFIVLSSGGFGAVAAANDDIYQMSAATSPYVVGATTNWLNGEALYVGDQGRPVIITLTPALVTNRVISATGRYE